MDAPELQQKLEPKMVQRICDAYELDVTALDETMEVRIVKSGLRDIHVCVKSRDDLLQAVQHEEEISRISEELDVVGVHLSCLNLPKTEQITAYCSNYAPLYDIPEECANRNIERWIDLLSVSKRNDSGKSDELFPSGRAHASSVKSLYESADGRWKTNHMGWRVWSDLLEGIHMNI